MTWTLGTYHEVSLATNNYLVPFFSRLPGTNTNLLRPERGFRRSSL
jgi:hypothetical protein